MRALVFDGSLVRFRDDYSRPSPREGEALIRVDMAGICDTDTQVVAGYAGFRGILGHEFVGTVEEAGPEGRDLIGRRVVGEINCGCGVCSLCSRGEARHCPARTVPGIRGRDGVFADYLVLPLGNLHIVPDGVSDEEAVFTEPLAAAMRVTEQVKVDRQTRTLVLGDGKLGMLVAMVLAEKGDILLVGRHPAKLAKARCLGLRSAMLGDEEWRTQFDVVVDATGSAEGLGTALSLVRPMGTIVLKTTVAGPQAVDLSSLVVDEVTMVGSRCGPFQAALDALAEGRFDVRAMISAVYPLSLGEEAMRRSQEPDALKVLLTVTDR